jgi:putative DNA primase/helicase
MVDTCTKNIKIATAHRCNSKDWKNHQITWVQLIERLRKNHVTQETVAEYKNMAKPDKDRIKDVGGFVGGNLRNGRRKQENVINRTLITLDADYAGLDFMEHMIPNECVVYSTHSHTPDNPRLRVVIPLNREVTPEEYQAISRKIAADIGLNRFDDTTFQPHRLM